MYNSNFTELTTIVKPGNTTFIQANGIARVNLWDNTKIYPSGALVLHAGYLYSATQAVGSGIDIGNTRYWQCLTYPIVDLATRIQTLSDNKLDKVTNATYWDQAYIKTSHGAQSTIDISSGTGAQPNRLARYDNNTALLVNAIDDDVHDQYAVNRGFVKDKLSTKLDLIEPDAKQIDFVTIKKDIDGYYQYQLTGSFTPKTSYSDFTPALRGQNGQLRTQMVASPNDLDAINFKYLNERLSNISAGGNGTIVTVGGEAQDSWSADSKLDFIAPYDEEVQFVLVYKSTDGSIGQKQMTGVFTPKTSYDDYYPVLRGKQGQLKGQTPPLENQTDLDLINRGEFNDGLSGKLDKYTKASGSRRLYGVDPEGNQYIAYVMENPRQVSPGWIATYRSANDVTSDIDEVVSNPGRLITGSPVYPSHSANKKYVDTGLDSKLDKVTEAYKIYGTDGSGNQKVYPTGWSATASTLQLMDLTNNGKHNDDGSFKSGGFGTYMVGIPEKPSHATPKKWVEDNFTVYKHSIQLDMGEGNIPHKFNVLSTRSAPYTDASELPKNEIFTIVDDAFEQVQFVRIYNDTYVSGIEYNHLTSVWANIGGTINSFFTIESDTVTKA